ncbi:MAG: anti-sigma factor antagonist [Actinomycetota bacterium]|nr:anti-sigma factor antagonist [Actinomycetota bacterium]
MTLLRQQIPFQAVSSYDRGGVTVISLRGELDVCHSSDLQAYFSDMKLQTSPRCVADLTDLAYIDCACLTVLAWLSQDITSQGGSFALAGPHGAVHRILTVTGMLAWFDVYASVEEAITRTDPRRSSRAPAQGRPGGMPRDGSRPSRPGC